MNQCLRSLACVVAVAAMAFVPAELSAKSSHKPSAPKKTHEAKAGKHGHASAGKARHGKHSEAKRKPKKTADEPPGKPVLPPLTGDLAALKDAIDLARKGRTDDASAARDRIADPAGQKLADWFMLRHSDSTASFKRYAAFLAANPDWPSRTLLRRRAEARLWQEKSDAATVHKFTLDRPISAKGKFALARVLLAGGETDRAARLVREAWRAEELSERSEEDSYATFRDLLSADDHRARM
ncbi:MAG: lytic transglycosylase domain-containing protein, partial [Pseudomonadota bacterium]